jgi:AcrR family transcriptional regulator
MDYNEKQVQIIETAEKLFADNGFEGSSIRDIAQGAGVNIAMISYYFGSKEKLMEAIFLYRINYTRLTLLSILESGNISPLQKIEKLIDSYIEKMMNNQCFYRLMNQQQIVNEIHKISDLIYESKAKNTELVKKIVHEGQKDGTIKKNIDVTMLMTTLIGTSNHFIIAQDFYKRYNNMTDMPNEEFQKHLKKKLTHHLKTLFKSTLTHEEK